MRLNLMSDLHLEFADLILPGGDVLILAGDVCEAKNLKINQYNSNYTTLPHENTQRRADRYARFFIEECKKYSKVLYVMGNHEHYHFCFDDTYQHIKDQLPDNVTLLENESVDIDGVYFIGASLWTDCNKKDVITMMTLRQSMNDYMVVKKKPGPEHNFYGKLTPEATVHAHQISKTYIKSQLDANITRRCVTITHHAPSIQSIGKEFSHLTHINGGYFSELEQFILDRPNCILWCHGHTHNATNYYIGTTQVMCNPRGYANYERRAAEFDPTVGFDL